MKYVLPKLPYAYDALEPHFDEATMRVHHDGHHKTYVDKLNEALTDYPYFQKPLEVLLATLDTLPTEIKTAVTNNGGGHANHSLFWTLLCPQAQREPSGDLKSTLEKYFGNFSTFKERFTTASSDHFSNGWSWLCAGHSGELKLLTTKDHESPITMGLTPLLVLDLWEHAYYLKNQNKRPAYIAAFWNVLNWKEVGARWDEFCQKGSTAREWRQVG